MRGSVHQCPFQRKNGHAFNTAALLLSQQGSSGSAARSGNGFSGPYTGLNSAYVYYKGEHRFFRYEAENIKRTTRAIHAGPLPGYQLRLFRHGYFDFNTSYNVQNYLKKGGTDFGFKTNIAVGLAF